MSCNHEEGCCGHAHGESHEHGEEGCGGSCGCQNKELVISQEEADFLMCLAQTPFLPVTRFIMTSTQSEHLANVALEPVLMSSPQETMETVKDTAQVLKSLEEMEMITLGYDMPLINGDYSIYESSDLYAYFVQTIEEGKNLPGALFDTPVLELGSIALTQLGQSAIEQLSEA